MAKARCRSGTSFARGEWQRSFTDGFGRKEQRLADVVSLELWVQREDALCRLPFSDRGNDRRNGIRRPRRHGTFTHLAGIGRDPLELHVESVARRQLICARAARGSNERISCARRLRGVSDASSQPRLAAQRSRESDQAELPTLELDLVVRWPQAFVPGPSARLCYQLMQSCGAGLQPCKSVRATSPEGLPHVTTQVSCGCKHFRAWNRPGRGRTGAGGDWGRGGAASAPDRSEQTSRRSGVREVNSILKQAGLKPCRARDEGRDCASPRRPHGRGHGDSTTDQFLLRRDSRVARRWTQPFECISDHGVATGTSGRRRHAHQHGT